MKYKLIVVCLILFCILVIQEISQTEADNSVATANKEKSPVILLSSGRMWQRNSSIWNIDYNSALTYCEDLNLEGRTNWRLPTKDELVWIFKHKLVPHEKGYEKGLTFHFWTFSMEENTEAYVVWRNINTLVGVWEVLKSSKDPNYGVRCVSD